MNEEELTIVKVAAVPGSGHARRFVYIETESASPTGLYQRRATDLSDAIIEQGFHYEEYGLVDDGSLLTRAEYDDGHAMISDALVDVSGRAELRVRYTSPYNFLIAAQESPINNSDFDSELTETLNAALKGSTEDQVNELELRVAKLPLLKPFYA